MKTILKMCAWFDSGDCLSRTVPPIQINELERERNKRRRKSCHTDNWIVHMVRLYATLTAVDSSTLLWFAPLCLVYLFTCRLCCLWMFFPLFSSIFDAFSIFVLNFDWTFEKKKKLGLFWKRLLTFSCVFIYISYIFCLCYCSAFNFDHAQQKPIFKMGLSK